MNTNTISIDDLIPQRRNDERIWVVRASGGRYVKHFAHASLVAIGHIDGLKTPIDPSSIPLNELKHFLAQPLPDGSKPSKATVSSLANQVNTFISDFRVGDLVLTLDNSTVAVGRITGPAFCDNEGVRLQFGKRISVMPFQLRRQVVWGPIIERRKLPYSIEASLKAHQTVFNLDDHWELLYHFLFPMFRDQNHVYFSTNIGQHKDINSYSVSQLLGLFSDLEAVVRAINPETSETLKTLVKRFQSEHSYSLTCKAEFMSEGHIWTKLGLSKTEGKMLLYFLVAWAALFGDVKVAGLIELNTGLISKEMRIQITNHMLQAIENRNAQDIKDRLQLNLPKYDVKPIQNIKKKKTIEI